MSAVPDDSAALADRLGRYLPADHEPVGLDVGDGLKGRAAAPGAENNNVQSEPGWPSEIGSWPGRSGA